MKQVYFNFGYKSFACLGLVYLSVLMASGCTRSDSSKAIGSNQKLTEGHDRKIVSQQAATKKPAAANAKTQSAKSEAMERLSDAQWDEFFGGYRIVDAAVANRNKLYFLLAEKDEKPGARIVRLDLNENGVELAKNNLYGYDTDQMFMEMAYPDDRIFVMDCESDYFIAPKGPLEGIPSVAEGGPLGGLVSDVRAIGKSITLVLSSSGDVMTRSQDEIWSRVGPVIAEDRPSWATLNGFDAYALDDIYVGGIDGLYHFDGTSWEKTKQPDGVVSAVCCAPDGFVYATTFEVGKFELFKGRDGEWEKIFEDRSEDSHANPLHDLVWHDGMLWASSWSELWVWKDGKSVKRRFPYNGPTGGYLSVRNGILLCGGLCGVHVRETGGDWRTLGETKSDY